jgi:hypothetical protein
MRLVSMLRSGAMDEDVGSENKFELINITGEPK